MPGLRLCWSVVFACAAASVAQPAGGFILSSVDPDPWLVTASGPRPGNGAPATITWSFVPQGTPVDEYIGFGSSPNNLISFLNSNFGGNPAQTDLTQQPWFHLFEESFGRWEQLSGVDYVYEPIDDGMDHPSENGLLEVRGDIRIGGISIDGDSGVLAFTYLPTVGSDMVFDTDEADFYSDPAANFINLRNTLMHEIGHSFGMLHVESTSSLLLEPFIDTSFDGPQLDEVRGVQFFFGDALEKSNGGLGNGSSELATSLGLLAPGSVAPIGADAIVTGQAISASATDFVSIANQSDVDYYQFTVSQRSELSATLTPRGGVFTQASEGLQPTTFNANARNNLELTLLAADGATVLATADANAAGVAESLTGLLLPDAGPYFARVSGADDTIQLYDLALSVIPLTTGDYNNDGIVNAADYTVWRNTLGQSVTPGTGADGTGQLGTPDGLIDQLDFNFWKSNYGNSSAGGASYSRYTAAVPEPRSTIVFLGIAIGLLFNLRRSKRRALLPIAAARRICENRTAN
jgi:hypothetical protein